MAYTASITRGATKIDLSSGYYQVDRDFAPPGTNTAWNVANGLYANRGGGEYVGDKPMNREWSFRVKINGDSVEHARGLANNLAAFIRTRDKSTPTFVWFKNNTLPEPLWGQLGASLRYEIVTADASVGELYGLNGKRAYRYFVDLFLEVKPEAIGAQQRLASAAGGIIEDVLGATDQKSKGLKIPEATTNKVHNCVFGAATFDTGYTSTNVVTTKNTDTRFCLPGLLQSAKVVGAPGGQIAASFAASNTNTHAFSFYVKRQDSGAVTSSDCSIYYNATKTTTFTSLGDGWYMAEWVGAGISGATVTGLNVEAGRKVYIGGFQIEEKAAVTPLAYGDRMGCAWTGTAHASTSTRTAAQMKVPVGNDTILRDAGSFSMVWKTPEANTMAANRVLFSAGATVFLLQYIAATDTFKLYEATNVAESAAQTFAAGTTFRIIGTWGANGVNLYINGVLAGTDAQYAVPDFAGNMTIGTDGGFANHANGTYLHFQTYENELTAAQVTVIDAELSAQITAGLRPGTIPWLWTKDGDNVIDNCDDSTRDNWCVIGGVPGNLPCQYKHFIQPSTAKSSYWLGGTDLPEGVFVYPSNQWFVDYNSTANGAYCGGGYGSTTGSSWSGILGGSMVASLYGYGKHNMFIRLSKEATSGTISVRPTHIIGSSQTVNGDYKLISIDTTNRLYYVGTSILDNTIKNGMVELGYKFDLLLLGFTFTAGGSNMNVDFQMDIPGDVIRINMPFAMPIPGYIIYDGNRSFAASGTTFINTGELTQVGNDPKLLPNKNNMVWGISAGDAEAHALADTLTFTTFITPNWSLI
jgi:hypothetical protein